MRLVNAKSYKLEEYFGDKIPRYAILSHRWESSEVTFEALRDGNGPQMAGWGKVKGCCNQARMDGWKYVWIDSCCIDKSSSAELSEAINSMFAWYENAEVCYTYLSDVQSDSKDLEKEFQKSQWFTRGWTLQELLAPSYVDFFCEDWTWIGSKSSLNDLISTITGVSNMRNYKMASVAQKMSWASKRETTRIEDQAYSLLGLFGVHMPPLYGEGENAFIRLQLEILNKVDDDSIFAWEGSGPNFSSGLLAPSPRGFAGSSRISRSVVDKNRGPCTMTSRGLEVNFILKEASDLTDTKSSSLNSILDSQSKLKFLALINCAWTSDTDVRDAVGLLLYYSQLEKNWSRGASLFSFRLDREMVQKMSKDRSTFYVPQVSLQGEAQYNTVRVEAQDLVRLGYQATEKLVKVGTWDWFSGGAKLYLSGQKEDGSLALVNFERESEKVRLYLGISNGRLWIDLHLLEKDDQILTGQERISLPFLTGSINARIFDEKRAGSRSSKLVELKFDSKGSLRWPQNTIFKRNVNKPGDKLQCDYPRCDRFNTPFERREALKAHFDTFHREDIGILNWRKHHHQWLAEREIDPKWWRCSYCLYRHYVSQEGWECRICHRRCEDGRIKRRKDS